MYSIKAIKQIKMRHWTYLFGFSRACMATDVRKLWTATEAGVQYHMSSRHWSLQLRHISLTL